MSNSAWKNIFFPKWFTQKNKSHQIAYIAMMTAVCAVANAVSIKTPVAEFSLTIAFSAMVGLMLGGVWGFVACFIGDLVAFFAVPSGYSYMPWIGISNGLIAFIFALAMNGKKEENKWAFLLKFICASLLCFVICTVFINTTFFWLTATKKTAYGVFLLGRLFGQGAFWNSLVNYALIFAFIPVLKRLKSQLMKE